MNHQRAFLATMDRFEAVLRPKLVADKDKFIKACAATYREHGTPNFFHLVDEHQQKLFETLKSHYRRVVPAFGALSLLQVKSRQFKATAEDALFDDLADRWIHTEGLKRSKLIADTTEADVLAAISAGMNEGEGTAAIADRISDVTDLSDWRSELIARTETHAAANYASVESVREAEDKLGVKMLKSWLPTLDGRTRPAHAEMEGSDPIAMDEKFTVDGEEMDRPGDPAGSPENVINCLHPDSVIESGCAKAMTRHWYEGSLVVIETASGNKVATTPNHPILTRSGWVPAYMLKEGDGVVSGKGFEGVTLRDLDIQYVKASVEKIYDALAVIRRPMRVTGIRVDFHGDLPNGEVDVVRAAGELRNGLVAAIQKPFRHLRLAHANLAQGKLLAQSLLLCARAVELGRLASDSLMGLCCPSKSFIGRRIDHALTQALAAIAWLYAVVSKAGFDVLAISFVGQSQGLNGLAVQKPIRDVLRVIGPFTLFGSGGSNTCVAKHNASAFQSTMNSGNGNTVVIRKLTKGKPSKVFMDKIVIIDHLAYSGYVYNMETETGYYICNGIVQHNCRCTLGFEEAKE